MFFFPSKKAAKKQPTQPPPLIHRCTILVLDGPKGMSYALATAPDPCTVDIWKFRIHQVDSKSSFSQAGNVNISSSHGSNSWKNQAKYIVFWTM